MFCFSWAFVLCVICVVYIAPSFATSQVKVDRDNSLIEFFFAMKEKKKKLFENNKMKRSNTKKKIIIIKTTTTECTV